MALLPVLARLAVIVGVMLLAATILIVGRDRIAMTRTQFRARVLAVAPFAGLLVVVLIANKIARDIGPEVSWLIGWRITGYIRWLDGMLLWPFYAEDAPQFVVFLQSLGSPDSTAYFAFMYVYGYVFLLVFPILAYFALPTAIPLRRTIVAYTTNYVIGVLCYVLFIAYGPREVHVGRGLLYETYPQYQFLTTAINTNVNVFPSLHSSLAVTVAVLAWTTRDQYPLWVPIAWFLAVSIMISTMYLGIHWATDVIAGIILGVASVGVGKWFDDVEPDVREWRPVRALLTRPK